MIWHVLSLLSSILTTPARHVAALYTVVANWATYVPSAWGKVIDLVSSGASFVGPLWLAAWVGVSSYFCGYRLLYEQLVFLASVPGPLSVSSSGSLSSLPSGQTSAFPDGVPIPVPTRLVLRVTGSLLLAVFVILKVWWLGCYGACLYGTVFTARRLRAPKQLKRVMQVFPGDVRRLGREDHGASGIWACWHLPSRPMRCPEPLCWIAMADRYYHTIGDTSWCLPCHLPMFDHFCRWLRVAVFLHTIKPYLTLMFVLVLDLAFVVVESAVGAVIYREWILWVPIFVSALVLVFVLCSAHAVYQFVQLGLRNSLNYERVTPGFEYWVAVSTVHCGLRYLNFVQCPSNPWDMGSPMANLRQALGESLWYWPLFWVRPKRVTGFGKAYVGQGDLPMGPVWDKLERDRLMDDQASGGSRRRSQRASTRSSTAV